MGKMKEAQIYDVPELVISPNKAPAITGNYEILEKTLARWKARVAAMNLTEGDMDEVLVIKKAAVAVRNAIDRSVEATKKALFNDPKKIFEARVKPLYSTLSEIEGTADKFLSIKEEERIGSIHQILDHYKAKFQEQYKLDEVYFSRIEYRKSYYNKTADEKERKDDLEAQFIALKKEQTAFAGNVRLIKEACKEDPRLNADRYIRDLLHSSDVASILDEIADEKSRLNSLDEPSTATVSSSAPSDVEPDVTKTILGIAGGIDFSTDFSGKDKTMRIQITYPVDVGDALTELFSSLRAYGIKVKVLKEEIAF